jgi:outer membrane protein assembly factor BamE
MRMLPLYPDRPPVTVGALCLVFAMCLAGCAAKNPLLEEPVPGSAEAVAARQNAGVQTTKEKRFFGIFTPYRVNIQQGNFVSGEMIAQLKEGMRRKEGMTRDQVRFVLGTPLLTDPFHGDRWDYVFRLQKSNGDIISSNVSVFFKDNRLMRFDGTLLPTEQDYLALIAGTVPPTNKTTTTDAAPAAPEAK